MYFNNIRQDVVWGGVDMKVKLFVLALVLLAYLKGNTSLAKPINIHQTFDGIIYHP
jgi:hypothetical protein